jgi:hypothetical protein
VSEASHSGLGLPDNTCAGEAKPEHTQKAHSIQLVTFGGNNSLKSVVRRPRISSGYRLGQLGSENWEADDVPIYSKADIHDQKPNVRFSNRALMSSSLVLWHSLGRVLAWVTLLFAVGTGGIQPLQA